MGLRCAAAGGRFLQARRRAAQRLCFCSSHFGVWEQWQVPLEGLAPTFSLRLLLRPSHVPQCLHTYVTLTYLMNGGMLT